MQRSAVHSRPRGRAMQVVLLLGAAAFLFSNLLGSAKQIRRDRRQQIEALQTWEGEGGAVKHSNDAVRTVTG
jgi:hypothetical protein